MLAILSFGYGFSLPSRCRAPRHPSALRPACASLRCAATVGFDEALAGMLKHMDETGADADGAVDVWIDQLDESFIPMLAGRVDAADESEDLVPRADSFREKDLLGALARRSQEGFDEGKAILNEILGAGEMLEMNARLAKMVKSKRIDAGFLYVLFRNIQDAEAQGDDDMARLFNHLHTVLQEELEKQVEPPKALLHKLTRTDDAPLRGRILRHHLVAPKDIKLPDGSTLPLPAGKAAPAATVSPAALADEIAATLGQIEQMPVEREMIRATAESIRQVAKEARDVVEEAYDAETLEEFQDTLQPAFVRVLG